MQELTVTEMEQTSGGLVFLIPMLIALDICIWTAVALK
jgi:hypothetical protein